MTRVFTLITLIITLFVTLLIFPFAAFADTYGSGNYGDGIYGAQSSSNSNSVSSAITSVGNTVSAFFCSNQAPASAPNLYEIDITSTTATLYFTPAAGPDNNYYISYGQGNNSEGYGVQISTNQSSGALFFTIQQLSPSTVYTFKVRGGNGCKPGPWSNTLTVQTLSSRSRSTRKFYLNNQATYIQAPAPNWLTQAGNFISNLLPGAPDTGFAPAKQHALANSPKMHIAHHASTTSLWEGITNFFSGLFHTL